MIEVLSISISFITFLILQYQFKNFCKDCPYKKKEEEKNLNVVSDQKS